MPRRKVVRVMVAVFILFWATQTLVTQWGYGAIIIPADMQPARTAARGLAAPAANPPADAPTIIEVRAEARIDGSDVTLRQVCRWSEDDETTMSEFADVIVGRLSQQSPVRPIDVAQIKAALHDRGANLSEMQFSGSASCAVRRTEVDDETFVRLMKQIEREDAIAKTPAPAQIAEKRELAADTKQIPLRDLLVTDLCDRLGLTADPVQFTFDPGDEPTLAMTEPACRFEIDSSQATALGDVQWTVTVRTDSENRTATIAAKALAWQEQLIMRRPLSKGQTIISSDLIEQRVLVETLEPSALRHRHEAVGQIAARDFTDGDIITAEDLRLPIIVREGQFITLQMKRERETIETVGRAMEAGARGDRIRVRNEATGQLYEVLVTAPAAGQIIAIQEDVASTN